MATRFRLATSHSRPDDAMNALSPSPETPCHVLVLQGGGALGSYQAGVYEAMVENCQPVDWVAGISIGAINAALIAGNPPGRRVERLRAFWEEVSSAILVEPPPLGAQGRALFNEASAAWIAAAGVPGFFAPRWPPALLRAPGTPGALSIYDTAPLRRTLERLVDFDRIRDGGMRLSVGAVNLRTGNFTYFDSRETRIGPEHIMASGALPPGFPPVEIDGEAYWDGGIVSNTPLQYVLDEEQRRDLTVLQVDLFSARGPMPRSLPEVMEREKDIRYSSRTRLNTDAQMKIQRAKSLVRRLLARLPDGVLEAEDAAFLAEMSHANRVTVAHLIYRRKQHERSSKDYEFSRLTMLDHWDAGRDDMRRALERPDWQGRCRAESGIAVFDLNALTAAERAGAD
ncbi:patatin-like phospholipase family protein [Roseomonas sp. OT10]|uniref:patatin-like phospholipase family protein n=1 Tax=Roseomonas cutis TaxID=2897332 RepID=UPI001E367D07|nr:patatin-like phospholipase family protein [Roseomonas sp. OT10]UFN49708.1 patatin-like phospholipase family protein [Roseomonas sp. OT10]